MLYPLFPIFYRYTMTHCSFLSSLIILSVMSEFFHQIWGYQHGLFFYRWIFPQSKEGTHQKNSASLTRGTTSSLFNSQVIRDTFYQVRLIVCSSVLFKHKQLTPSNIVQWLSVLHCYHWISGILAQYEKNAQTNVFTVPLPIKDVPADQKFLYYFISPKITSDGKDMWIFKPSECANGSTQIHSYDFTEPFPPIIGEIYCSF